MGNGSQITERYLYQIHANGQSVMSHIHQEIWQEIKPYLVISISIYIFCCLLLIGLFLMKFLFESLFGNDYNTVINLILFCFALYPMMDRAKVHY